MEHPKLLIVDWVNALLAPVLGPLLEPFGLRALPGARRPEKDQVQLAHFRKPS